LQFFAQELTYNIIDKSSNVLKIWNFNDFQKSSPNSGDASGEKNKPQTRLGQARK